MILNRLKTYLEHRTISFNKFEISLGVSHGSISNAWKHEKNIGSNVIEKILEHYTDINAEWLLRGEGEMIRHDNQIDQVENRQNDNDIDQELISRSLLFFNLKSKSELRSFYKNSLSMEANARLEQIILSTWEEKYGQELKSIKHQLHTLFTAKLDGEQDEDRASLSSKAG